MGDCAANESGLIFGTALLTSYLGLFINFYNHTYKASASKLANGKADGHTPVFDS
ncbi:hypothetical protein JOM56_015580 [Amanita muscaria]